MAAPEICPVCGAEVPKTARACPECGADETTGWDEGRAVYDGLDLPEAEFDYDDYLKREFGHGGQRRTPKNRRLLWLGLAAIALAALVSGLALM